MRSYALVEWTRYDPVHRKPLFNPMWSRLFANLKRLGGGGGEREWPPPNLAISSQMMMKLDKGIPWLENFTN